MPLTISPDPTVYVTPCTVTDSASPATLVQVPEIVGVLSFVVRAVTAGLFSATTLVLLPYAFVAVAVIFAYLGSPSAGKLAGGGGARPGGGRQAPPRGAGAGEV